MKGDGKVYKEILKIIIKNMDPINLMLFLIFMYPILKGFIMKFSAKHLKNDVRSVESNISFVISIALGIYCMKNIFFNHNKEIYKKLYNLIPEQVKLYVIKKPIIVYLVAIPVCIFIIHNLILLFLKGINSITLYPVFDGIERKIRDKSSLVKRLLGCVFQIPKGICYVIIVTFLLNFISILNLSKNINSHLEASKYYNYICKQVVIPVNNSKIAKRLPNIVNNSFKIVIKNDKSPSMQKGNSKTIIYYNGITLDEGVKSDENINKFARNLVKNCSTDREKAKKIYNWIGKNISYDNKKAEKIFKNIYDIKSGAIPTYYSKKGICFDYSCLYVVMCRANNMDVRLITGRGFNGVSWVGHAWNQVYLKEEKRWINVDTTFSKGGNYFDTNRFIIDHGEARIAGEWRRKIAKHW